MTQRTIPWESLSEDALRGVIEEFVTREGTDYGQADTPLAAKRAQILRQLQRGEVEITWDQASGTCSIRPLR